LAPDGHASPAQFGCEDVPPSIRRAPDQNNPVLFLQKTSDGFHKVFSRLPPPQRLDRTAEKWRELRRKRFVARNDKIVAGSPVAPPLHTGCPANSDSHRAQVARPGKIERGVAA